MHLFPPADVANFSSRFCSQKHQSSHGNPDIIGLFLIGLLVDNVKIQVEAPDILLVLDELDQLHSKDEEVLFTLFELPHLRDSKLILVGIANALDMAD